MPVVALKPLTRDDVAGRLKKNPPDKLWCLVEERPGAQPLYYAAWSCDDAAPNQWDRDLGKVVEGCLAAGSVQLWRKDRTDPCGRIFLPQQTGSIT